MSNLINLKTYFKFLGRNKVYTAIDIFGLSISLMFVLLIGVYVSQELSVDKDRPNKDRIYIEGSELFMMSAYGIGERLMDRFPEIEKVMTFSGFYAITRENTFPVRSEGMQQNANVGFSYEDFFEFFDFDLIVGDRSEVLKNLNSAVITPGFARRMYGNENPLGKVIWLDDEVTVTVAGIMKNFERSVIPDVDMIVRMEMLTAMEPEVAKDNYENAVNSTIFLLAREGADLQSRTPEMAEYLREFYWIYEEELCQDVVLTPLSDAYFNYYGDFSNLKRGDRKFVMILLSVGILILLFAIFNYINLTVAQSGFRAKEVAIRDLLGSSRYEAFVRLIAESTLLTTFAFLIALVLAFLSVPYANELLQTNINLTGLISVRGILAILFIILLLGCISGIIPALLVSRNKAIDVVKGVFRQKTKMVLSKIFITFQNTITIGMVIASLVMVLQIHHLIKAPLGYETDSMLDIWLQGTERNLAKRLSDEFKQLSVVKDVGLTCGTPYNKGDNQTIKVNDQLVSLQKFSFDRNAFDIFGFTIIQDNHVPYGEGVYLTEQAFIEMNLPQDATIFEYIGQPTMIAGVVKDFQLNTVLHGKDAIVIHVLKPEDEPYNIVLKVQGDPVKAWNEVKEVYERTTGNTFTGKYIDQQIQDEFESQRRTAGIVMIFCLMAIVISLLGLLAMSTYFIQQRLREITIRKIFGSENRQILRRLISVFLNYVLIAFVIATPIIYYIMREWLSDYSYRITLHPAIFLAGGLFCFVISFLTVFWQSYYAAIQNPAKNIKIE